MVECWNDGVLVEHTDFLPPITPILLYSITPPDSSMKILAGILLIPFCVAITLTLAWLVRALGPFTEGGVATSAYALLTGFLLWMFVFYTMSRPMRTYVLGHELTHALWGYLMGAGIVDMKVSGKGGSVTLTKNNFLITLAPYFFPFYTGCVIVLYGVLSLFFDQSTYEPFWLGLVGLTWGFHVTFTLTALVHGQPDIEACGKVFSYAFIYLTNALGICMWVVAVATPTLDEFMERLFLDISRVGVACWSYLLVAKAWVQSWLGG